MVDEMWRWRRVAPAMICTHPFRYSSAKQREGTQGMEGRGSRFTARATGDGVVFVVEALPLWQDGWTAGFAWPGLVLIDEGMYKEIIWGRRLRSTVAYYEEGGGGISQKKEGVCRVSLTNEGAALHSVGFVIG